MVLDFFSLGYYKDANGYDDLIDTVKDLYAVRRADNFKIISIVNDKVLENISEDNLNLILKAFNEKATEDLNAKASISKDETKTDKAEDDSTKKNNDIKAEDKKFEKVDKKSVDVNKANADENANNKKDAHNSRALATIACGCYYDHLLTSI